VASDPAEAKLLEEERRLIEEAQRGNLNALRPLLEKYATPLYSSVIMPRVGNTAAAEDILRETFLTAVSKIDKFRWQGRSLFAWLRQIAVNKAYDLHRKSKRQRLLTDAMAAEPPTESAPETGPDAMLIAEQERNICRERIDVAMDKIAERYRSAIQLRLIDELPRDECAAKLNVTVGTFDVLLYRAVRAFRKHYGTRNSP
jgi:RNA polymerase sigma-70 factor (ECF subfamily)